VPGPRRDLPQHGDDVDDVVRGTAAAHFGERESPIACFEVDALGGLHRMRPQRVPKTDRFVGQEPRVMGKIASAKGR
jgi:hypothetical protein